MQRASEHKTKKNCSDLLDYELFRLLQELIGLWWISEFALDIKNLA